jgi:hypothetical protein
MKKDDSSLDADKIVNIKKYARGLLLEANAFDVFPTPVDHLVTTAKLFVNHSISLEKDEGLLEKFRKAVGKAARPPLHGIKNLLGLIHIPSGEILLDHSQHENRKTFIKLHETGHGVLPHQRKMYELMEDGIMEIHPEVEDIFEREANNFAVETLFQLDKFETIAADYEISVKTPVTLSKKFGSSTYASMRRYVRTHFAPLALAVYDLPNGNTSCLRRMPMYSESFIKKFNSAQFPAQCDDSHFLGTILNSRSKLQTHHMCEIHDLNGDAHETVLHLFCNSFEKFIMIMPVRKSSQTRYLSLNASLENSIL